MIVAQIMAGAPVGGAELFFERLCGALHRAGETIFPVIRRDRGREARLRGAGLAPAALSFGGPFDFSSPIALERLLREKNPAVAVAWMGRAAAALPAGPWTSVGRLGGYYDLKRFARCRHLVGNTAAIAEWIRHQGWPAERVHYLANFVPDLRGIDPAPRPGLGVPDEAKLILALGRLHRAKGFDILVEAMAGLPGAHALIAGEGPERERLTALAARLGIVDRVHLIGWRTDIGALLAACDVFVCPSRHEPLGNAVLEAWSAARPVVAAAAEGPRALIRDGADGVLAPVENVSALRETLAIVLETPGIAATLAGAGRERYEAGFTEAAVVAAWRGFFASVAP